VPPFGLYRVNGTGPRMLPRCFPSASTGIGPRIRIGKVYGHPFPSPPPELPTGGGMSCTSPANTSPPPRWGGFGGGDPCVFPPSQPSPARGEGVFPSPSEPARGRVCNCGAPPVLPTRRLFRLRCQHATVATERARPLLKARGEDGVSQGSTYRGNRSSKARSSALSSCSRGGVDSRSACASTRSCRRFERRRAGSAGRSELCVQEVGAADDAETHILQLDLFGACNCFRQRRIVGKLHGRPLRPYPVFGMAEPSGTGEASRFKLGMGKQAIRRHGHTDIECGAGLSLVGLERYAADDRVRHFDLRKNPGEHQEGRTLRAFHLTSQPEPLPIQDVSLFKSIPHHGRHHSMGFIAWLGLWTQSPHTSDTAGDGL
jgi:hypothetical protein